MTLLIYFYLLFFYAVRITGLELVARRYSVSIRYVGVAVEMNGSKNTRIQETDVYYNPINHRQLILNESSQFYASVIFYFSWFELERVVVSRSEPIIHSFYVVLCLGNVRPNLLQDI